MKEVEFKHKLRQAHVSAVHGAQAIVEVLADHEEKYLNVSLDSIDAAATRLENGARQLRDLMAVASANRKRAQEEDDRLICAECKERIDPEDETILGEVPFHKDCSQDWCERFSEEIGKISGTIAPDLDHESLEAG